MKKYLEKELNYKLTENGAITYSSTLSKVLDFFAVAGSMREKEEVDIIRLFEHSFDEDPLLTLKALFYIRDIEEGLGERRIFRVLINHLAKNKPEIVEKNINFIIKFGRYDDLYSLFDTPLEDKVVAIIKEQLNKDILTDTPSLLAKWLKSINTSSKESRRLAKKTAQKIGLTYEEYRKTLSNLRKKIKIVEQNISEKRYEDIDYPKVPSQAMLKYMDAFKRNDEERFEKYLNEVKEGKKKVNTKTLYPHQIVNKVLYGLRYNNKDIDMLWSNLPNNVKSDALVVADVSGSMEGLPITVSIAMAIYIAERLPDSSPFKNHFITFSAFPKLQKIIGGNIVAKIKNLHSSEWGFNTDIEQVFLTILKTAIKYNLKQEDLPKRIIIISDMEFDKATKIDTDSPIFDVLRKKFKEHGYSLPTLIFWNVAGNTTIPVTKETENAILVSGFSTNVLKSITDNTKYDPVEFMLTILLSDRYKDIAI